MARGADVLGGVELEFPYLRNQSSWPGAQVV